MSASHYFEEDDLAMYAMGLLDEADAATVARAASEDVATRRRLALVQAELGAFAETAVDLEEVPAGSLDRLMNSIAQERRTVRFPAQGQSASVAAGSTQTGAAKPPMLLPELEGQGQARPRGVLPWAGWAVAAGMAVAAGTLYHEQTALRSALSAREGQTSAETAEVARQRDSVAASADAAKHQAESLAAERAKVEQALSSAKSDAARGRSTTAEEAAALAAERERVNTLTAQMADAEQQRSALEAKVGSQASTVSAQQAQIAAATETVARLTSETARAREVLETLNDRAALRVTLLQPKSKPEPTGRTTYVASRGTLIFQGSNLAALAPNKVYELWLLPADGSAPVPAGTFSPDARGNANLVSPRLTGDLQAKAFAITVEDAGGSQTPTMPILLVGTAG